MLGDTVANVLAAAGFEIEREYYVNDAGSQVRKFGESVYARYAQALGRDEPFPEDGYQGDYVVEMGQRAAQQYGDRFLDMPREEATRVLGAEGIAQVIDVAKQDLADLGVVYDTWFHEKGLYESGLFDRMLEKLRGDGYITERDDAVWFTYPEKDVDAVVIRSPQVIPAPSERPTLE